MDELTSKMHEEFSVPPEVEKEHNVLFAKMSVESGRMTKEEALDWYKITEEEYDSIKLDSPSGNRLRTRKG